MKSKTFIILLVIFCVLAGAVYFNFLKKGRTSDQAGKSRLLFDAIPVTELSGISIHSNEGIVVIKKDNSVWVIEKKYNYLADFSLINQLVNNLKTAKVGRSFESSADAMSRLGLQPPEKTDVEDEDKGIRISLKNAKGDVLADVIIGKTRELTAGSGGHYIMPTKGNTIYLVDKKFEDIGKTDLDWIEKNVLDIKEDEIEKVVCYPLNEDKILYTLKRPEKGKPPLLVDMAKAAELNPSKVDDVMTALEPLSIDDIAGYPDESVESGISYTHRFEYTLYNGDVYNFIPGRAEDENTKKYYLKIALKKEGNPEIKTSIRHRINQWVYEIPEWKYGRFIDNSDDLMKRKE